MRIRQDPMHRLLVVDNQRIIAEWLRAELSPRGYSVFIATTTREAIDLFNREQPALTLLSLGQARVDALKVLQHIRRRTPTANVLMLTGAQIEDPTAHRQALGAHDSVSKSFPLAAITTAVDRLIRGLATGSKRRDLP
ncbi:MAG: response regulator transcription factor [Nitrospirales bacterium]